jgi:hypothetical protein
VGATAARRSANRASRSRDALAQLRVIEEVLGETVYSLALAVIVEERSFIAIGKQFGCDARTIKKWSAAAVAALAVV